MAADEQLKVPDVQHALDRLVEVNTLVVDQAGFYERTDCTAPAIVRLPTEDVETHRPLPEVPLAELGQVVFRLLGHCSQSADRLVSTVAALYRWEPSSERLRAVIQHIVSQLLSRGHFAEDAGVLSLSTAAYRQDAAA